MNYKLISKFQKFFVCLTIFILLSELILVLWGYGYYTRNAEGMYDFQPFFEQYQAFRRSYNNYPPYRQVQIDSTNLPVIFINTNHKKIDREKKISSKMVVINNGNGLLNYADTLKHNKQIKEYDGDILIRYRGNTSFSKSVKKPYLIVLQDSMGGKREKALLSMRKNKKWALQAPYIDKSLIRDVLVNDLAQDYFDYTPQSSLCEVILNGQYYGVYFLSERPSAMNIKKPGENGDELTGGYVIEMELYSRYKPAYYPSNNWHRIRYNYKKPDEEITPAQKKYINDYIKNMENAFLMNDYYEICKYIDIESFIDYQLFTEFTHNYDGYARSVYLYKERDSKGGKFKTALWDFNVSMGNGIILNAWKTDTWHLYDVADKIMLNEKRDSLFFLWGRLLTHKDYLNKLIKRWHQYRSGSFSDANLMHKIDSLSQILCERDAEKRNSDAWLIWGGEPKCLFQNKYVSSTYNDEIGYLKSWILERVEWMDKNIEEIGERLQ